MDFSPRISNLQTLTGSISTWNPIIPLQSSDFGSSENEVTLSLHRLIDYSGDSVLSAKTFIGMDIHKQYSNTIEYKIAVTLKWIAEDGVEVISQRQLLQGRDWCLATPTGFPTSYQVSNFMNLDFND